MICPLTQKECNHNVSCDFCLSHTEMSPPTTLADIERLLHEHETKAISYYKYGTDADEANLRRSRAALMAAIQRLTQ